MKSPIIGIATEVFFFIEKMQSLITQQSDVRVLREKIVDRGGACLLHACDDKIDT